MPPPRCFYYSRECYAQYLGNQSYCHIISANLLLLLLLPLPLPLLIFLLLLILWEILEDKAGRDIQHFFYIPLAKTLHCKKG